MAKYVPKVVAGFSNYVPSNDIEELSSYASKAMRAKIIADRYTRGFERAEVNGGPDAYEYESANKTEKQTERQKVIQPENLIFNEGYTFEEAGIRTVSKEIPKDFIAIVDIDTEPARYIKLPFVPGVLEFKPESNFVGLASFGRNNPFYQYTGSEDTLSFTIDWHSNTQSREDVIFYCRWLESLTKANGYESRPHRVMVVWGGGSDDPSYSKLLGPDNKWLLVSAPYTLTQFNRGYRDPETGEVINTNMLPQQAIQNVVFKRLAEHNYTTEDILGTSAWNLDRFTNTLK